MRIYHKSKTILILDCGCKDGNAWVRFGKQSDGAVVFDKFTMCNKHPHIILTKQNQETLIKWLR